MIIGMDYQKYKYSEDTDIDDVKTCNDKTNYIRKLTTDRISLYIEMRMPKALVNNWSNIIVDSLKQSMLLYFQR